MRYRVAGTMVCMYGGPTNQNKCCVKSGGVTNT